MCGGKKDQCGPQRIHDETRDASSVGGVPTFVPSASPSERPASSATTRSTAAGTLFDRTIPSSCGQSRLQFRLEVGVSKKCDIVSY